MRPPIITLTSADAVVGLSYVARLEADNTFLLSGVFPGKYFVKVSLEAGTYVKRLKISGRESTRGDIDLTPGRPPQIELIIGRGTSTVSGTVKAAAEAKPNFGLLTRIILVPKTGRADGTDIRFRGSDREGHFTFDDLAPGRYQLFATLRSDPRLYQSIRLMHEVAANRGIEIQVPNGEQSLTVEVPVISTDSIAEVLSIDVIR